MATSLWNTTLSTAPLVAAPAPAIGGRFDLGTIAQGAADWYAFQTAIDTAKYGSKVAKANLQNQLYATRAAGQNVAETARAGYPSPSLLLVGGLALAALVILKR